jgi:hypothetical protein
MNDHPQYGELVGYDPVKKRWAYAKPKWNDDGQLYDEITVVYDIGDTLALNHERRMETQTKNQKMGEWVHTASIPPGIMYGTDLNKAHNEGDEKYVKRWLEENWKFKTTDKKL